jgi:DNA-binding MarR family transcriptional regulator
MTLVHHHIGWGHFSILMSLYDREIDPEDKRIKRLYLTDKGRKLRPEMERIGLELNSFLLK